jgi:molybdopterin/thiamine biosynthesis adenylyltransferase
MASRNLDFDKLLTDVPVVSSVSRLAGFKERGIDPEKWTTFLVIATYERGVWRLLVSIPKSFPYNLPRIYIENAKDYPAIGHINWQGGVCYKDHQGLVVNYRDQEGVLCGCLMEALRTLHHHYNDITRNDLFMEYEDYWESLPSEFWTTMALVEHSDNWKILTGYLDHQKERKTKKPTFLAIYDQEWEANEFYWPLEKLRKRKQSKVLYLPLVSPVTPPSPLSFWTCKDIGDLIDAHADLEIAEGARVWAEKQKWDNTTGIIFSHPKPSGERALWGVLFSRGDKAKHPLASTDIRWEIKPIHLQNHTERYLLHRGGADVLLRNKKVAVIGCGSVGGNIANNLAKSGVGELHLYDYDFFYPENIYRHVLGGLHIEPIIPRSKVHSLSSDIMINHPFAKAVGYGKRLLDVVPCKDEKSGYDAIVVATGDFTGELIYNQIHHNCDNATPVIYAWQDGFGIGGHCMRVTDPKGPGCLECLYTRSSGFEPHPKTSFIAQGQTISKHIGGCGGVMTPYSYLDASQTAILATRATIEALKGECGNEFRSWKGSPNELKMNGYNVSAWYEKLDQGESQDREKYVAPNCKVCGTGD